MRIKTNERKILKNEEALKDKEEPQELIEPQELKKEIESEGQVVTNADPLLEARTARVLKRFKPKTFE